MAVTIFCIYIFDLVVSIDLYVLIIFRWNAVNKRITFVLFVTAKSRIMSLTTLCHWTRDLSYRLWVAKLMGEQPRV